jgi:hypothetical protein
VTCFTTLTRGQGQVATRISTEVPLFVIIVIFSDMAAQAPILAPYCIDDPLKFISGEYDQIQQLLVIAAASRTQDGILSQTSP